MITPSASKPPVAGQNMKVSFDFYKILYVEIFKVVDQKSDIKMYILLLIFEESFAFSHCVDFLCIILIRKCLKRMGHPVDICVLPKF